MDEQKKLILTDERAFYLIKHFEEIDQKGIIHFQNIGYNSDQIIKSLNTIGSKFYARFCSNPFDLMLKINNYKPFESIDQSNGNKAIIYKIPFTGGIGTNTILNLKEIQPQDRHKLNKLNRNGFYVNVLERSFFEFTNQLVVICNQFNQVMTIFPGLYAPAFPTQLNDENEIKSSILFWENHVFIRMNK